MIPPYTIRQFEYPKDYLPVIELWNSAGEGVRVGRSDSTAEIEKKLQRDPDLFLVVENDQGIIATVLGGFDGRRGLIYHLAVALPYRRLGVAKALMNELERRLKEKGCIRAYLLLVQGNQEAFHFYTDQNWEALPVTVLAKDID